MSRRCQVLGTVPHSGHRVSHSHKRTKRTFSPNLQKKTYWVPTLGRRVTLTVSARGIKKIDAIGIDAVVAQIRARGERV